jgi:hypothetical protein
MRRGRASRPAPFVLSSERARSSRAERPLSLRRGILIGEAGHLTGERPVGFALRTIDPQRRVDPGSVAAIFHDAQ